MPRFNYGGQALIEFSTVSITPLGAFAGKEPILVNMWRSMFQMDPLPEEEAVKALSDLPIAGGTGKIFDLTGEKGGKKSRIVTAMLNAHLYDRLI